VSFKTPVREYVLKTTVDRRMYEKFASLAETNRRSLANQLLLAIEEHLKRQNGRNV
jgi:hypothetical protein